MLFYTKQRRYSNIKIADSSGKDICKFTPVSKTRGHFETNNAKIITILKNKNKYPWIFWDDEAVKEEKLN